MQAHRIIYSEPLEPVDEITGELHDLLHRAVQETIVNPTYYEAGRLSTRVSFEDDADTLFHDLARFMTEDFLGTPVRRQTVATISIVTDGGTFREVTSKDKAATKWHQDSQVTPDGFSFLPEDGARLILPMQCGPQYVSGEVLLPEGRVAVFDPTLSTRDNRLAALSMPGTIYGADGVLARSAQQPLGAEIMVAKPDIIYKIPRSSIHKTNPDIDTGRAFFFLDY